MCVCIHIMHAKKFLKEKIIFDLFGKVNKNENQNFNYW